MATKELKLRRADKCSHCSTELAAGTRASWDSAARTVTCLQCISAAPSCNATAPSPPEVDIAVEIGVAGASARAKGEALRAAEELRRAKLKEQHRILGRIGLAMVGPSTEGQSWLKGAIGEELVGAALDALREGGVMPLHDRRIPKSSANIDHLAVTPNGVWVIDPKRYSGKVEVVNKGGWFSKDIRLLVGGRDRTKLVTAMHRQRAHVIKALAGTDFAEIPVYGALCFVDSSWPWFAKPQVVDGIVVSWGKALWPMVTEAGDLDAQTRAELHRHLARTLPPK